jgi:tellurite resistance protein TerC
VVEITTVQSLVVIVAILVVTVYASLRSPKGKAKTAVSALRRHCADYLEFGNRADPGERERAYARLVAAERQVSNLEGKFKALIREPEKLKEQVERVHRQHSLFGSTGSDLGWARSVPAFAPEARP